MLRDWMRGRRVARTALILTLLLLPAASAHATKVAAVGIEEMVAHADRIFVGICQEALGEVDPKLGIVTTRYIFSVSQSIKGATVGSVRFRQYGGRAGKKRSAISGLPSYRPGEEVVLFLKPDSDWGLTSPVGLFQGRYSVVLNAETGRKVVVPDLYAPHLSGSTLAAMARGRGKPARMSREGRMDLEDFLDMIEGMVKDGR